MAGDYDYSLYPMEPEELDAFLSTTDCDGFNVTIPYKIDAMRSCAELSERARAIGCVNTLTRREDGAWRGDNTDWDGFLYLLGADAVSLSGRPALILGSGGASRTVQAVLESCGIPHTVISRSGQDSYENISRRADAELIVNTTPVGMYPKNGAAPIDLRLFPKCRLVLDLVYNPLKTALVLQAEELGIPAHGGLAMLAAQGVRAAELFTRRSLPKTLTEKIADTIARQMTNTVLIGMPGCGKTTTAKALGALTGRPVYDIDSLIVEREGRSIPQIFASDGEEGFRRIETAVLEEVSKKTGVIIATGGGVVTQPRNLPLLRQNGVCVWLNRHGELPTDGRPLSQSKGVQQLRAERAPLYEAWSDCIVSEPSEQKAAQKIMEELYR